MKQIRKAVSVVLINNNKVVAVKYTNPKNDGYYDIPGGKIEDNETSMDAAIREFKEETGMDLLDPIYSGNLIIEYQDRIYDLDIYLAKKYKGNPSVTKDNISLWIDIDDLLNKTKNFAEVHILDEKHYNDLVNVVNFKWHFISNQNHQKIKEIIYQKDEKFWYERF